MTQHPPHIPSETSLPVHTPRISKFFLITLVIGATSGAVAALAYSAYGPTPATHFETTRVERDASGWDESKIMFAQEATGMIIPDTIAGISNGIGTGIAVPDAAGFATAITSDGWFLTTSNNIKGKRLLLHPQTTLPFQKIVVDPGTSLVYVKVDAKNLRVLDHVSVDKLQRGMRLALVTPHLTIPVTLQDTSFCIVEHCPWEFANRLSYAPVVVETIAPHAMDGAAAITMNGDLVGVAATVGLRTVIIPIDKMESQFATVFNANGVLDSKPVNNTALRALNLTRWSVPDTNGTLPDRGLYIEGVSTSGGVSGLRDGDIIFSVEHEPIEAYTTLFDIVRTFESRSEISMTVLRKGISQELKIHLSAIISGSLL